jgi:hypothetical protein
LQKLDWMREERICPNGIRYLWTDAFGVVLLVSLYHDLGWNKFLDEAEEVVAEVEGILGRPRRRARVSFPTRTYSASKLSWP